MAEYPAALGQAYFQKCGTVQGVREPGVPAMKADQVFDAALNLDPNKWEARLTKALAMSYGPTQMGANGEHLAFRSCCENIAGLDAPLRQT